MHLSSSKGPIDVFLCTDPKESNSPLRNGVDVNGNDTAFCRMSKGKTHTHTHTRARLVLTHGGTDPFFWSGSTLKKSLTLHSLCRRRHQRYRNTRIEAVQREQRGTTVSVQLDSVFHPGSVRDALAGAAGRRVPAGHGRGAGHQRPVRLLRPGHAASGRAAHGVSLQVNRRRFTRLSFPYFFLNLGEMDVCEETRRPG